MPVFQDAIHTRIHDSAATDWIASTLLGQHAFEADPRVKAVVFHRSCHRGYYIGRQQTSIVWRSLQWYVLCHKDLQELGSRAILMAKWYLGLLVEMAEPHFDSFVAASGLSEGKTR